MNVEDVGSFMESALKETSSFVDDCVEVFGDADVNDDDFDEEDLLVQDEESDTAAEREVDDASSEKKKKGRQDNSDVTDAIGPLQYLSFADVIKHPDAKEDVASYAVIWNYFAKLGDLLRDEIFRFIEVKNTAYYGPEKAIRNSEHQTRRLDRAEKLRDLASRIMRRRQTTLRADNLAMNFVRLFTEEETRTEHGAIDWILMTPLVCGLISELVEKSPVQMRNSSKWAGGKSSTRENEKVELLGQKISTHKKMFAFYAVYHSFVSIFQPGLEAPTSSPLLKTKMRGFIFNSNKRSSR
ncbi:hypothetical protein DFJ73DRAFT_871582 [Zopfochytrium polystomum]|nr:hypothetical protein DFJ73DRAFT_967268 [Zopfochytrium polystomum]KAI9324754.1 hypothetical protein DFJ73DRAFT_871582 [Zopfochytrium polystomum]